MTTFSEEDGMLIVERESEKADTASTANLALMMAIFMAVMLCIVLCLLCVIGK